MGCGRSLDLQATLVASLSTTAYAIPAGSPMRSNQMSKARADIEINGLNGNLQVAIGVQTSNDLCTWTDETGTFALGYQTADGMFHANAYADFGSIVGGKQWFRPCYYVKLGTGSTLATAFVSGSMDLVPRT